MNYLIEPNGNQYKVMAQDSSCGVSIFWGTHSQCLEYIKNIHNTDKIFNNEKNE